MRNFILSRFMFLAALFGAFVMCFPFSSASFAAQESIAVVVNEGAISSSDLEDRMALVIRTSGVQDSKEIREKVRPQVLSGLVEEELKLQEAQRLEVEVSDEEVMQGFATLSKQNNFTPDQFRGILKKSGINVNTMYRQIRSQIGWGKVVQSQLRPQVKISDADVNAALERLKQNIGKAEYRVAEIFLPIDDPRESGSVRQLAQRLTSQIKGGKAPFPKVAQQFSKSAGAAKGGDMGWVQEGQVDPALEKVLKTMATKSVSDPVKSVAGYHILFLIAKRQVSEENMPDREGMLNTLGAERLERLQRKYLLDLKANAFIENRV